MFIKNAFRKNPWKKFVDFSDYLEKRNSLKEIYEKSHWENLDLIMPCDPGWKDDMYTPNDPENPLAEIDPLCFNSVDDIHDFLLECAKENLPGAKDKLRRVNKIIECME